MKYRLRYAPSPTGFFHIGGARTALLNYLYAKHFAGEFIVRIEDTDVERNVEGGIDSQLNNLAWMNIAPDESLKNPGKFGPYVQSEKLKRYQDLAHELLKQNKAYYCFCTKEELDKNRKIALENGQTPKYNRACLYLSQAEIQTKLAANIPYVIRLKMTDNINIEWDDLIRGRMSVPTSALTDPVLLKANGIPMYNFAVVVDDYDMQITHILRGDEHLSNTPYQIAIKQALGFDKQPIAYGHMSIIVDETGKKLSKRNKELKQFIEDYKTMGFLPIAIDNFLALLGWTAPNNKEIFSLTELVTIFDPKRLSKAPAFFDFKKLLWISSQHFKLLSDEQYLLFVKPFLKISLDKWQNNLDTILLMFKSQLQYASQLNDLITQTFCLDYDESVYRRIIDEVGIESFKKCLQVFKTHVSNCQDWTLGNTDEIINLTKKDSGLQGKALYMPMRYTCIFKEHGPEMNKIIFVVGKQNIIKNIEKLLGAIQ